MGAITTMDAIQSFENGESVSSNTDWPAAVVELSDKANALVSRLNMPKWTEDSHGRVISLNVASDGLSAAIVAHGVGETNISVMVFDDHGTRIQAEHLVKVVDGEPPHGRIHWTLEESHEGDDEPVHSSDPWILAQPMSSQDEFARGVNPARQEPRFSERLPPCRTTHTLTLWKGSRHHHRHRFLVASIVVFLLFLSGIGYVSLSYVFRSHPGAKSMSSAIHAFRSGQDAANSNLRYEPPVQGVYELKGQGSERISFPPNSQSDGAVMPASVTYSAHGCWLWHLDYNTAHWDEYDFCPRHNRLLQIGYQNFQSWDFGTLKVTNLASFTCPSDPIVLAENPLAGQVLRWTCSGTNTSVSGKTIERAVTPVVGTTALTIGKTTVKAVHEVEKITLSGVQKGTVIENWWFSTASGLPLRVERQITIVTASPLGTITYNEDGSWRMASLTPRT
jgi:hypothetical protein